jgi:hypothetical protein
MAKPKALTGLDLKIADDVGRFFYNPTGFVRYAYPWTEPGVLASQPGPDAWQVEVMDHIGEALKTSQTVTRVAIASGHGVGKSTLASWLVQWFMSTRPNCGIVATANTKNQLQTKLWRELALWDQRLINRNWFTWMATSYRANELPETWVADAIPWSEHNSEAFAGLHARDVLVIFDEASAIPDIIWDTIEGAYTTSGVLFVVMGNPTRSSGSFFECFGRRSRYWKTWHVDSRTARMTNKAQIAEWLDIYGEDSDFARVRVYGQFPRVGDVQFLATDVVDRAMSAVVPEIDDDYLAMGVDVARFGSNATVITLRSSNRMVDQTEYRGLDTMMTAAKVAELIDSRDPDVVFVDGVGLGAGVVDRLRQLGFRVVDVQSAAMPNDDRYLNKRAEMWGGLKEWLNGNVSLLRNDELRSQLIAVEYGLNMRGKTQLESKADMQKRGLSSPDRADSLALTFAEPIRRVRYDAQAAGYYNLKPYQRRGDWRTA